tara:strand:- start:493 stop:1209 length:717 start_codon:yes stop_codon:yes gene_type:complete
MKLLSWASTPNLTLSQDKSKYLLETSNHYNVPIELIGVGYNYRFLKDKIYILKDYIQGLDNEELVICIDAFDTLINTPLTALEEIFNSFNTEIVISSEQIFTYQWGHYKDKFDQITSPYRYVNSGTIMGKVKYLKKMIEEILSYPELETTEIDQGLVGIWVYNNIDNPSKVKLDTECKITWVVCGEWHILKEISEHQDIILHPILHHQPPIIHVPGSQDKFNYSSYKSAYNNIIQRKI